MILLLLFLISSTQRSNDAKKPKPKNTLCACADFIFYRAQSIRKLIIFFLADFLVVWQNTENDVNSWCVIKFPKIRETVFYNRWIGGWTKSKNEYFSELYITQTVFRPFIVEFYYHPFQRKLFFGPPLCTMYSKSSTGIKRG